MLTIEIELKEKRRKKSIVTLVDFLPTIVTICPEMENTIVELCYKYSGIQSVSHFSNEDFRLSPI